MREPVTFTFAAPADLDAIAAIEAIAFPAPWSRHFFEQELRASGRFNLIARRGAKVIGYLFAMWIFDEMHVNKIAISEEERRQGIARALMEECFTFARARGIKTISLEVRQSNQPAQDFYRTLDFTRSYVRPHYYPDGESAVVMTLVL